MIFTKKVNRLEYLTRMGFDNRQDEKKELMKFFSKLERSAPKLHYAASAAASALWELSSDDPKIQAIYADLAMALIEFEKVNK